MDNDFAKLLKVEKEAVKDGRLTVKFTVSAEDFAKVVNSATSGISAYAAVPGFRKGHAPAAVLRKNYAAQIQEEAQRRLFSAAYTVMSEDKSIEMLSCSPVDAKLPELAGEYTFSFFADLAPEFDLGTYKGLEIKVDAKSVSDAEVEERIKSFRTMYSNYADVQEAAAKEDMLKVSYTSDFALPENAPAQLKRQVNAENTYCWLAEPELIPGVIAALTGAKAGETKEFTAEYPADYRVAELAGKKVAYKVQVAAVQRRQELSDAELCERVKVADIGEFKKSLRESMEREADNETTGKKMEAAYEMLDKQIAQFEIPAAFVQSETTRELRRIADQTVKSEGDAEAFKKDLAKHEEEAKKAALASLRKMLILRKIAKQENLSVSDAELSEQIAMMSRYYGYKGRELASMMEKSGAIDEVRMNMLSGKVLNFVVANAKK